MSKILVVLLIVCRTKLINEEVKIFVQDICPMKLSSLCQCIAFTGNAWDVVKPLTSKGTGKVYLSIGTI